MFAARSLIRIAVNVAIDGVLSAAAAPAALWLANPAAATLTSPWLPALGAATLLLAGLPFRLPLQYWRFAGIEDLLAVAASSAGGAALLTLALVLLRIPLPSPAFPFIHGLTLLLLLGIPRVVYRRMQTGGSARSSDNGTRSILLVGAGKEADLFLRALASDRSPAFRVEGLLATSSRQTGRRIQQHPILGPLAKADAILEQLAVEDRLPDAFVIATPELSGQALADLVDCAERYGIAVQRAPQPTVLDPAAPRVPARPIQLRPVAIEDLLNRPQVPLDRDAMARLIQGRRVMVTGAGGTIGSELARQVAALGPERLVLLDSGEYALWQIDLELAETYPEAHRHALIADVRDETRVRAVFEEFRPELVFHAAALKHVPMVEDNPSEGLLTNAAGTRYVADAARAVGARAMVLISTDKAVNPTSVMGASKRLAEMYCQALDIMGRTAGHGMRCITVRFGNVLGSTGSVVPLFQRQLARGGPLTVTHPDMRRYFMTVREAVGLVLQASVLGIGDVDLPAVRDGGIFVLDMGEPVKIVDLARQIIRLAGLHPEVDVEIRFTGLRPGEKLHEELFHGQEPPVPTGQPGLLIAAPRTADPAIVGRAIDEIATACRGGQTRLALALLGRLVPEFAYKPDAADEVRA